MMDVYFVVGTIAIVLYTKCGGAEQFVIFDEFDIPDGMDLLSSLDNLVGSVRVNVFD
jgi:hypothetical protein